MIRMKLNLPTLSSLLASPTVSVELKSPIELNLFSDASRVRNQEMKACS